MRAIKAHLSYISRQGALEMEDERGEMNLGREALDGLVEEWRFAGSQIPFVSHRREAFNILLSMPPDTDAAAVFGAAREFATAEFAQHKFALVLHEPQADPRSKRAHVHLVVRAQGRHGERLNPRMMDLARWRQEFADRLMQRGIVASATRRAFRGAIRSDWHSQEALTAGEDRPRDDPLDRVLALRTLQDGQWTLADRDGVVKGRDGPGTLEREAIGDRQSRGIER